MRSPASETADDRKPVKGANEQWAGDGFNLPRTPRIEDVVPRVPASLAAFGYNRGRQNGSGVAGGRERSTPLGREPLVPMLKPAPRPQAVHVHQAAASPPP